MSGTMGPRAAEGLARAWTALVEAYEVVACRPEPWELDEVGTRRDEADVPVLEQL